MANYKKINAVFKAFSPKTGGICLETNDGESWFEVTGDVKRFVGKIKKGSEVSVTFDESGIVNFIQQTDNVMETEESFSGVGENSIMRMSLAKTNGSKKMCALNNATSLVIAQGGNSLDTARVLENAKEFLNFLQAE